MEEEDIQRLFLSVADRVGEDVGGVRRVFSILVRSTLTYRDRMLASAGIVVTVADVRAALEWLLPSLLTGRLPDSDDPLRLGLLKVWLDELKPFAGPHRYLH